MRYDFRTENGAENFKELYPLYARHYHEMWERLKADGIECAPFAMRVEQYFESWCSGHLINYVVRTEAGEVVGYSNIYLTNDMHNGEFIATEDAIYILPGHRNGIGRKFAKAILDDLKRRGVKRLEVQALTDLRVAKLWKRMGFRHTAHCMTYTF